MLKKLFLPILIFTLLGSLIGCNSKTNDDQEVVYVQSSAVNITAFSLQNNPKVLDSLANVFFSIDLINGKIFNADSMPYGTKVTRLIPVISAPSTAMAVELKYYDTKTQRDSVVNYLTNSTDSIDFTQPVKLTVTSQSGAVTREYTINVNVHKVKADSLAWYAMESAPMPTTIAKITGQCTAMLHGTYYCLTTDGTSYCLATTTDPADPKWQTKEIALPFAAEVSSLRATDEALYMLSNDGTLHKSTDGTEWSSVPGKWSYIYGAYGEQIIGANEERTQICAYPSDKRWAMPADFPTEEASIPTVYTLPMGYAPQLVMVGGKNAQGQLLADAWGFDGNEWAKISNIPLPEKLTDVTLVAYDLVDVLSTNWTPFSYPALLAFGGRVESGAINRKVYYSRDWGMTWRLAPDLVQLPDELPPFYGASAFTYTTTMHTSREANGWTEIPVRMLPPQCSWPATASRATAPITEWECPAIYLFGGKNYQGETLNTLWRGVIVQYTFKPVQ